MDWPLSFLKRSFSVFGRASGSHGICSFHRGKGHFSGLWARFYPTSSPSLTLHPHVCSDLQTNRRYATSTSPYSLSDWRTGHSGHNCGWWIWPHCRKTYCLSTVGRTHWNKPVKLPFRVPPLVKDHSCQTNRKGRSRRNRFLACPPTF